MSESTSSRNQWESYRKNQLDKLAGPVFYSATAPKEHLEPNIVAMAALPIRSSLIPDGGSTRRPVAGAAAATLLKLAGMDEVPPSKCRRKFSTRGKNPANHDKQINQARRDRHTMSLRACAALGAPWPTA